MHVSVYLLAEKDQSFYNWNSSSVVDFRCVQKIAEESTILSSIDPHS